MANNKVEEMMEDNTGSLRIIIRAKNNKLIEARETLGFNQLQMAEYCGVSVQMYGAAERLEYVSEPTALKISSILHCEPSVLFPNWLQMYGEIYNKNNYLIVDDDIAQKQLAYHGGSKLLLKESFNGDLKECFSVLKRRERVFLVYYFGLLGRRSLSLDEIAERFNLTRERVRQIKEKALRRLRHMGRTNILKEYLNDAHFIE